MIIESTDQLVMISHSQMSNGDFFGKIQIQKPATQLIYAKLAPK